MMKHLYIIPILYILSLYLIPTFGSISQCGSVVSSIKDTPFIGVDSVATNLGPSAVWYTSHHIYITSENMVRQLSLDAVIPIPSQFVGASFQTVSVNWDHSIHMMAVPLNSHILYEVKLSPNASPTVVRSMDLTVKLGEAKFQREDQFGGVFYIADVNYVVSVDYNDWELIHVIDMNQAVGPSQYPVDKVTGFMFSPLEYMIYVGRGNTNETKPGQIVYFQVDSLSGMFSYLGFAYTFSSPSQMTGVFDSISGSTIMFWNQLYPYEGTIERYSLGSNTFMNATYPFPQNAKWGATGMNNEYGFWTYGIHGSLGFTLVERSIHSFRYNPSSYQETQFRLPTVATYGGDCVVFGTQNANGYNSVVSYDYQTFKEKEDRAYQPEIEPISLYDPPTCTRTCDIRSKRCKTKQSSCYAYYSVFYCCQLSPYP
eukprot:TRINITY_DN11508_c0_g1_i1.p1 TRINITY_DN11508_c0_g1~~TRINITY_DN11508_c0_g1_i1.p1  ORF type:complete len:427 (+),score=56.32 TRINITY_DN11508_c0_g1_i1:3-1283(+)